MKQIEADDISLKHWQYSKSSDLANMWMVVGLLMFTTIGILTTSGILMSQGEFGTFWLPPFWICAFYFPLSAMWQKYNGKTYPRFNFRKYGWAIKTNTSLCYVVDNTEDNERLDEVVKAMDPDNIYEYNWMNGSMSIRVRTFLFRTPDDAIIFKLTL